MKDILLEKAFLEPERWRTAMNKGLDKGISEKEIAMLQAPEFRAYICKRIADGEYQISPPHIALIPKDTPGEFRTVYINENVDRVLLSLVNDLLFDLCPGMIHKSCKSYQKGLSCGKTVVELSNYISKTKTTVVGWKSDLSKYFDSVPIEYIDAAFDSVERKFGKSSLLDVVRDYYHSDLYIDPEETDENGNPTILAKYQSLKQGCAVASWLANVLLYDLDDKLSRLNGKYVRYSDDMMFVGDDHQKAMTILTSHLAGMGMKLNPKKVEQIDKDHWVKFLGYSIKGSQISLSSTGIKRFQKEIEDATINVKGITYEKAKQNVYKVMYKGYLGYSWASRVLRIINVDKDINVLNGFVMDCLRAVQTGKKHLGGLGFVSHQKIGCIQRGTGRNVKANRQKVPTLEHYYTVKCMAIAIRTSRAAFDALVAMEL